MDPAWVERCLQHQEYLVATDNNVLVAYLRFSLFWGTIPYLDLIWVEASRRRQGIGTALFQRWEQMMRDRNATVFMTSSELAEPEPQQWHLRNGFQPCGQLTFGQQQPTPECFFIKNL